MHLELSDEQATELLATVDSVCSDLSVEIADTDNAGYRRELRQRRDLLQGVAERLRQHQPAAGPVGTGGAS